MSTLSRLAEPMIAQPSAVPPSIETLRVRANHLRRRRWAMRSLVIGVAAAVSVVSIGAFVRDNGNTEIAVAPKDEVTWLESSSAPVPRLDAIGAEVVATVGEVNGQEWELIVYEVASAPGHASRRVCSEIRTDDQGVQSCFPIVPRADPGARWMYAEQALGRTFLVVAADAGVVVSVDDAPVPGLDSDVELPVQMAATLVDPGTHAITTPTSVQSVVIPDLALDTPETAAVGRSDGVRSPLLTPAATDEEIFFERLRSDNPARDGWIRVAGPPGGLAGYLNPVDMLDIPSPPGEPEVTPTGFPVYNAKGRRVGWMTPCGFSVERDPDCVPTTVTTVES